MAKSTLGAAANYTHIVLESGITFVTIFLFMHAAIVHVVVVAVAVVISIVRPDFIRDK